MVVGGEKEEKQWPTFIVTRIPASFRTFAANTEARDDSRLYLEKTEKMATAGVGPTSRMSDTTVRLGPRMEQQYK